MAFINANANLSPLSYKIMSRALMDTWWESIDITFTVMLESGKEKVWKSATRKTSFSRNLDLPRVNTLDNIVRWLAFHCATNTLAGTQDLLYTPWQLLRQRFWLHYSCNINNFAEGDVSGVLDVLLLLSITRGLCEKDAWVNSENWNPYSIPLRALITREDAEGTTATCACRFWMVSWTVTRRPFQADVALAISSPTFFGDCIRLHQG